MKITYDKTVDSMYIQLKSVKDAPISVEATEDIVLDYVGKKVVGIEILTASKHLNPKDLSKSDFYTTANSSSLLNDN